MYSQIQTLKNKYPGIDRLYCKGNISLLDNVLVKKIGIVGPQNATSISKIGAADIAYTLANISDNFIICTRITPGVDNIAHTAAVHNPRMPNLKHRTIAVVPNIDSSYLPKNTSKLQNEIIKNDGLIISPMSGNAQGIPKIIQVTRMIDIVMANVCDAIIFCDFDHIPKNGIGDPYFIYEEAWKLSKKLYLSASVESRVQKALGTEPLNNVELQKTITKMYYDSIGGGGQSKTTNTQQGLC